VCKGGGGKRVGKECMQNSANFSTLHDSRKSSAPAMESRRRKRIRMCECEAMMRRENCANEQALTIAFPNTDIFSICFQSLKINAEQFVLPTLNQAHDDCRADGRPLSVLPLEKKV